jgi:hypothetical protein
MKKVIFVWMIVLICVSGYSGIEKPIISDKACLECIAKKMGQLGFEIDPIVQKDIYYWVPVKRFTQKTNYLKHSGRFRPFLAKIKLEGNCRSEERGVEPSPFIVFSKQQFLENHFIIEYKLLPKDICFR